MRSSRWSSATSILARRTIENDHKVNQFEVETDELCLVILAKRQPMASDLRFITLALKMVTDLERIGDLAVNICERALDLAGAARRSQLRRHRAHRRPGAVDGARRHRRLRARRRRKGTAASSTAMPRWTIVTTRRSAHLLELMLARSGGHRARHPPAVGRQVARAHGRSRDQHRRAGDLHGQGQRHPPRRQTGVNRP